MSTTHQFIVEFNDDRIILLNKFKNEKILIEINVDLNIDFNKFCFFNSTLRKSQTNVYVPRILPATNFNKADVG